jgi:hypothetical protein
MRHFFRADDFQRWAMRSSQRGDMATWSQYKSVAKRYILEFTGDRQYFEFKEKQDSLRNLVSGRRSPERQSIVMWQDFRPEITVEQRELTPEPQDDRYRRRFLSIAEKLRHGY